MWVFLEFFFYFFRLLLDIELKGLENCNGLWFFDINNVMVS